MIKMAPQYRKSWFRYPYGVRFEKGLFGAYGDVITPKGWTFDENSPDFRRTIREIR